MLQSAHRNSQVSSSSQLLTFVGAMGGSRDRRRRTRRASSNGRSRSPPLRRDGGGGRRDGGDGRRQGSSGGRRDGGDGRRDGGDGRRDSSGSRRIAAADTESASTREDVTSGGLDGLVLLLRRQTDQTDSQKLEIEGMKAELVVVHTRLLASKKQVVELRSRCKKQASRIKALMDQRVVVPGEVAARSNEEEQGEDASEAESYSSSGSDDSDGSEEPCSKKSGG